MAAAIGAIKGFFHIFGEEKSPQRHLFTILDVLEPQGPQG